MDSLSLRVRLVAGLATTLCVLAAIHSLYAAEPAAVAGPGAPPAVSGDRSAAAEPSRPGVQVLAPAASEGKTDTSRPRPARAAKAKTSGAASSPESPPAAPDKRTDAGKFVTRWAKDVTPESAWPEYPRPAMVRPKWLNLNGLWDYAIVGPTGVPKPANVVNAEADPLLKSTPVPPAAWDGKILVPFTPESPLSMVSRFVWPGQVLWYRKTVEIPADWRGQHCLLHFQAVDWHCVVWVNGRKVGEHKGGYTSFAFDVTEAIKPQGLQEITLAAWDPTNTGDQGSGKQMLPQGDRERRFPPSSGIWQSVWMEPVPAVSIERLVLTPDVDRGALTVQVELRGDATGCEVELRALDGERTAATATAALPGKVSLAIPQPKLWSPDSPFLYGLKVTLRQDGQAVDEVTGYFGMRNVRVARDEAGLPRIQLNGKPIFLFGPLDQGIWPDGIMTPPTDAAARFEVQYLKDIGCNMARVHVTVHPERWYYWCDKLGIAVWQDFVCKRPKDAAEDSSTARQWEAEQREMMDRLAHHPAVMLWVCFNETWGQYGTARIAQWVAKHDPSRLVCSVSGWDDYQVGDTFDIHDYTYHPSVAAPGQTGDRAMSLGECGGFNIFVPGHTWAEYPFRERFDPAGDGFRPTLKDGPSWEKPYAAWAEGLWLLRTQGLCAAVYTQIYDTGGECNGWLTYDRAVSKIPPETLHRMHSRLYQPLPELKPILPPLAGKTGTCRWRSGEAPQGWEQAEFDDSAWASAGAPLALKGAAGSGKPPHLYARRAFTLESVPKKAAFRVAGWADFILWVNGRRVQTLSNGRTESYAPVSTALLTPEAMALLRPGRNVLAVEIGPSTGTMRKRAGLDPDTHMDMDFGLVEVKTRD